MRDLLGQRRALREFLNVDDLGEACVFAMEHWSPAPGEITYLNVGTGVGLGIRELAEALLCLSIYHFVIACWALKHAGYICRTTAAHKCSFDDKDLYITHTSKIKPFPRRLTIAGSCTTKRTTKEIR